ncbi:ABC transporter permease [Haloimpatiens sp. FM7330]|uniref:ABC transporter permease n=1 Tax=Haloimpatiens sp. FM7330 TaxID=3298610 RepID=UPI003645568C
MNLFSKIHNICIADFRERTRSYNFLILLGLVIFGSFFIIPSSTNSGENLYLLIGQDYRPVYNSAFIGTAASFLSIIILSLFGFYVINNSIKRDRETRVGEIIASSPVSKNVYILGKLFSNFLVLFTILAINSLVIIIIYLLRGQEPINLGKLLAPSIMFGIPALLFIASIAVLFETIGFLKGTIGNIVYFFLWCAIVSLEGTASENANISTLDLFGIKAINQNLANISNIKTGDLGLNWVYCNPTIKKTVLFEGINWQFDIFIQRIIIIIAALLIALLASAFFDRFTSTSKKKQKISKKKHHVENDVYTKNVSAPSMSISKLTSVPYNFNGLNLINVELKLLFKNFNLWLILLEVGLNIACILAPIQIVQGYLFPIVWLLPIAVWSSMGNREIRHNTDEILFSSENFGYRQLPACLAAGTIVSFITGSGFFIRLLISGNLQSILPFAAGAVFIPSLAIALGVLSNSSKLFEIMYLVIWYLGPMNHIKFLNFAEILNNSSYLKSLLLIMISMIFLLISLLIRQLQIENQ